MSSGSITERLTINALRNSRPGARAALRGSAELFNEAVGDDAVGFTRWLFAWHRMRRCRCVAAEAIQSNSSRHQRSLARHGFSAATRGSPCTVSLTHEPSLHCIHMHVGSALPRTWTTLGALFPRNTSAGHPSEY